MLYSRINLSERKYMFLEILQKKRDLKKLVKFAFYIKKVAHYDLSPKTDKTCYLIWCISIVIGTHQIFEVMLIFSPFRKPMFLTIFLFFCQ